MLALERKNIIKGLLLSQKSVLVADLAKRFEVTEETIRRDLKSLEKEGVAEKTHGGAIIAENVRSSFDRSMMKNILSENKGKMALLSRAYIRNGHCIFFDSSTTVQYLLPLLHDIQVTIATNAVDAIATCSNMDNISLLALGGVLNHRYRCFTGSICSSIIGNYYFDLSVISCRTLSIEQGLTDSDGEDAEIKRLAIKRSKKIIVLADHTKFDKVSFVKVCDVKQVDVLITDVPLRQEWEDYLTENSVALLVADTHERQPDIAEHDG